MFTEGNFSLQICHTSNSKSPNKENLHKILSIVCKWNSLNIMSETLYRIFELQRSIDARNIELQMFGGIEGKISFLNALKNSIRRQKQKQPNLTLNSIYIIKESSIIKQNYLENSYIREINIYIINDN